MRKELIIRLVIAFIITVSAFSCSKKEDPQNPQNDKNAITVKDGKYLVDGCGNKLILRGVNIGNVYAANLGKEEINQAALTGANSMRLVLTRNYTKWVNGNAQNKALDATEIEELITLCLEKEIIPVLELHDFTGSANVSNDLASAVGWWTRNDIKTVLQKHQHALILNIANEPEGGMASDAVYTTANNKAVKDLRAAGYTCPIMIDAPNWGKDSEYFVEKGQELMNNDPMKNLIFSVHAYWPTVGAFGNYSDANIQTLLSNLAATNLPITIGELAKADIQNNNFYAINYSLLMQKCQEYGFGYLVWWWGFTNPGSNNALSMTPTGLYTGLDAAGKNMAETSAYSIKKTSVKACGL